VVVEEGYTFVYSREGVTVRVIKLKTDSTWQSGHGDMPELHSDYKYGVYLHKNDPTLLTWDTGVIKRVEGEKAEAVYNSLEQRLKQYNLHKI